MQTIVTKSIFGYTYVIRITSSQLCDIYSLTRFNFLDNSLMDAHEADTKDDHGLQLQKNTKR
jgi:hypothetical protein